MAGARRRDRGASRGADPLWSKAPLSCCGTRGCSSRSRWGAPARARRFGLPAVHLVVRERARDGPDPRPLVHALGGRDDVPERCVAAPRPGPARGHRAGGRHDLAAARRGEPLPRRPARVGAQHGHTDHGCRRAGAAGHAAVHRRAGARPRRHPRGVRRRRRAGPRPDLGCPRHHPGGRDRDRLARHRDRDVPGRRDLPIPVQGRGLRVLAVRGTTPWSCTARTARHRPRR
jgi:hypothetical protein